MAGGDVVLKNAREKLGVRIVVCAFVLLFSVLGDYCCIRRAFLFVQFVLFMCCCCYVEVKISYVYYLV